MRQSYFISVVFLWFIGYLLKETQSDCEPRLYVNASAAPGGDGSSWANAFNKLQDAISQANSCATVSEIWVAQGTYYPDEGTGITDNDRSQSFNLKNGLAIYGGFTGNETDLDQRNWETTILSGEIGASNTVNDNSIHVVRGIGVNNTAILDGFTITAGNANAGALGDDGGGIYNYHSTPQILNCSLSGNRTSGSGGGMFNDGASPIVINCSFSANIITAGFGGGGAFANLFNSSPTFTGCSFSDNSAINGGAGMNVNSSQTFINCSFSENAASANGAGMYNASCTARFINCIFSINLAAKKGAGMYNSNADVTIINCSFRGNSSIENGGGIYNFNSSDPVLTNCILWGNINGEIVNDDVSSAAVSYSIVKGGYAGTGNLDKDPLFVNAGGGNLRLQACSPAIDAGSNTVVTNTTDVEGNERLINATNDVSVYVDMGAYEFAGTASTIKYYPDADGDQQGDPNNPLRSCNVLSGYVTNNSDCNDGDATVYSGAPEICDGIDNNCDGVIDPEKAWYQDLDNDKWGNFGAPAIYSCTQPAGYVDRGGDCNDIPSDDIFHDGRAVNPGMIEICGDLQDNDCNGLVDDIYVYYHDADGDGLGNPADKIGSCSEDPPQHYVSNHDDCNDTGNPFTGILYVNVNATGPIYNGLSWSSAYKNLQDALTYACSATTQIWVAQGTYYPDQGFGKANNARYETFILKNNVAIYGGFAGGETQLSQRNWKVNITTLSGDVDGDNTLSGNSWHVVFNDGNNLTNSARLDGFHITGGNASGYNFIGDEKPYQAGAGMYNKNSFPTVANCVFESNSSWAKGGAVYNWNTGPTNTSIYENCSFISNNVAGGTGASGGAMYNEQVGANMINCEFFANIAQFRGGAIYNYGTSGITTVTNCVFYGNVSTTPGKDISNFSEGSGNINSCIFWGDNSPIYEFLADHLTVSHSIVQQASGVYPGTGNLNVDPLFIDQGAGNLRLQIGSPAINAGDDAANNTSYDLDFLPRKVSTIDMGAYEFGSSTPGCTDETAPTFTGSYADENLGCNPANPDGSLGTATATDASGAVTITSIDGSIVSDGCNFSKTRTFIATDGCNNTASTSRTVRWKADLTPPTLTPVGTTLTLGLNPSASDIEAALGTATATDACGNTTVTSSNGSVTGTCSKSLTRTFTAEDGCGNTATAIRTVTWTSDVTPPTVLTKNIIAQITQGGDAIITASQVDNGSYDACGGVTLSLNKYTFYCENIGINTVTLTATDANGNTESATAVVTVEDHVPPTMFTKNITVQLNTGGTVTISPSDVNNGSYDACSIINYSLSKSTFNCSNVGLNTVALKATDANGNTASANAAVTVEDKVAPTVLTKNITAQITQGGDAIITAAQVDNGSHDACGGVTLSLSKYTFYCEDIGPNTVILTATDANGNTASATATVTVEDHFPPTIFTKNITVQLNAGGAVTISPGDVNNGSYDACSIIDYSLSKSTFNCSNVGPNTVALKATDANGNTATANATVTIEDHVVPTMLTRNITVQLSASGSVTITAAQINNGSFDACGIINYSLSKSTFNCSNVGPNTVALKATDANGNTATANATVTVEDKVAPIALAKNITAQITQGGDAVITAAQVDNGSNDACGSITLSLNKYTFYCQNIGPNTVTLTATDGSGNTSTATAIVTVEDHFPPTMLTKNITIQLNAGGTVTISPNDVNNGSYDACSIINYSLSKSIFNCSNIGPNTVTLKATDANGNTATAAATVTVVDNLPPTVITRNVTINLNASGQASVTAMQVNNNSADNCSIPSNGYLLSKTSFDCSNTGSNTVTLKVTDASGNTATANAAVTVIDNLVPVANCKNITVYLGTNGLVNITGTNLNNNSSDNCQSSLSFSVSRTSFNSDDLGSSCEKAFNVVLTATDGSGNSSTCSSTVTVKRRITKIVYNGITEGQYSDLANLSATLYDITDGLPGVAIADKTVTFTLGAQSVSDTYGGSGQGTNSSGIANGTLVLNQDPVPAYTIGISFAGDGVYCASSTSTSFDIKPEDLCSQYNGQLSVKASVLSKTNSSAKVLMSVGIADATDGNAGDVTKAKVEFNYGSGWITVPIQALNAAKTIGNATYTATVNFTGDGSTLNFNYRISGYYQINQECSDNGQSIINVYKPQGEFITGGGYIESTNRSVGIMPADEGGRANFGFNVKYNQKGTNLQGNISYIFRRKVNDVIRLYQVKGNSMTSLVVNMNDATEGGMKTAVFIGKCNVTDVTDPLSPVAVAGAGNNTMQVIITDVSETGVNDKYGITIWTPTNQVFHSSNWEGTKTTKLVLSDGDVVVGGNTSAVLTKTNNTGTGSSTPEVDRSTTVEKTEPPGEYLKVTVMPNPSSANFRIVVNSNDLKKPVKLLITDMLGRVIETRITNAGQTITIGDKYISGTYAVRIMQGRKIKQLELIKLSD